MREVIDLIRKKLPTATRQEARARRNARPRKLGRHPRRATYISPGLFPQPPQFDRLAH